MHYEINISKNGHHVFCTHERSLRDEREAREIYGLLVQKFPTNEGYKVDVTRWETRGNKVEFSV